VTPRRRTVFRRHPAQPQRHERHMLSCSARPHGEDSSHVHILAWVVGGWKIGSQGVAGGTTFLQGKNSGSQRRSRENARLREKEAGGEMPAGAKRR